MTSREAALRALTAYRRNKAWPELALGGLIERYDLSTRDASLATRILNGVIQNMMLCDYYISRFSTIGIKKIEPNVLDILRISVYQLVFLDKIPPSAAVNEGVALARKAANPRAAGFINAVLRKIALSVQNNNLPEITGDPLQRLSIKYSHPEWLVREISKGFNSHLQNPTQNEKDSGHCRIDGVLPPALTASSGLCTDTYAVEQYLAANNNPDLPVFAQVNTLLADVDSALDSLRADGVDAVRHNWLDNCIELRGAGNITRLNAIIKGAIYIQDAAAYLSVMASRPKAGDFIVDGCAAPGGKSFTATIAMKNKGTIIACDINDEKLKRLDESAKRLGISIIDIRKNDALTPEKTLINKADTVFADVPCSGFGVIRKKPEIRYKTDEDTSGLPDVQLKILTSLSSYVKPGGILLYSTCTVLRRENEGVAERFLRENTHFTTEGFSLPGIGNVDSGMITLWPHIHGTDGFFICKLKRI